MARRPKPKPKPKTLAAVRPNLGLEAAYKKRLMALIDEMNASVTYWLEAQWKKTPPLAADELPVSSIQSRMSDLGRQWQDKFDEAAPKLAEYFAKAAKDRTDAALKKILADAGISVPFKQTRSVMDVYKGVQNENVSLIKSIASEYLSEVEGMVMRSVTTGRDLGTLSKELQARFGITKRRAALISRDQNNKATAVITRARQAELGITQAVWVHSSAGKHPRPSHVAFAAGKLGGPVYEIAKGAYLDGVWTWPGVEINCRCVAKSIIPALQG